MSNESETKSTIEKLNDLRKHLVDSGAPDDWVAAMDDAIKVADLSEKHPMLMDLAFTGGTAVGMMKTMMNSLTAEAKRAAGKVASMVTDEPKRSADDILAMYAVSKGLDPKEEFDSAAKDLITDILHSLRKHDIDPDGILYGAQRMFDEEVDEEESVKSKGETRD